MSLLVSSAKLRATSPVFAVMFDGQFMEGQGLTPAPPRVVPLPDENLQHMLSICKAIHGMDVGTCCCNGFEDLVDFATTVDKYDCAAAISELSRTFVLRRIAAPEHPSFDKMLFVTFVLDLPQEFNTVVKALILADEPVNVQTAMCGRDILPLSIFNEIQKARGIHCSNITALLLRPNSALANHLRFSRFYSASKEVRLKSAETVPALVIVVAHRYSNSPTAIRKWIIDHCNNSDGLYNDII